MYDVSEGVLRTKVKCLPIRKYDYIGVIGMIFKPES